MNTVKKHAKSNTTLNAIAIFLKGTFFFIMNLLHRWVNDIKYAGFPCRKKGES
jgi:hypothetical protein